jgi:hypothetical protein
MRKSVVYVDSLSCDRFDVASPELRKFDRDTGECGYLDQHAEVGLIHERVRTVPRRPMADEPSPENA